MVAKLRCVKLYAVFLEHCISLCDQWLLSVIELSLLTL